MANWSATPNTTKHPATRSARAAQSLEASVLAYTSPTCRADADFTASPADFGDSARYPIGSGFDRIVSEMGVTGGCLHLGVSQQFSDHW